MAQQIQIRRDISSNWTSANPILAQGEMGLETNTLKVKFGDGTTAWNSLAYFGNSVANLTDVTLTSLASGNVLIANASGTFINQSLVSLVNQLVSFSSLGSLAFRSTLSSSDVGLGNVTNDAQLKIASNLSDLNNVTTARGNLSLGSLAVLDSVPVYTLPSTVSSNAFYGNNGLFASQVSIQNLNGGGLYFQSGIISGFQTTTATVGGQLFANGGIINASTVSTQKLNVGQTIVALGDITGANLSGINSGDQLMPVYGDGADGYITLDGTATYPLLATLVGTTYTLLRDIYCTTFNIYSGITLDTAGYRIFANVDCIVEGTVENNGANASGTTGGAGGTAGFFKAGTAGVNGLNAASAGANGTAVTNPTAATWIGGLGGRGGSARTANTTFIGSGFASANVTPPANADGGARIASNYINYLNKLVSAATPYQFTPSAGGGAGAKSTTGTTAVSGGGGGGGGTVFIASPNISGAGVIQANGGAGGNASGTGGTFGGGGGGGGGVVALIRKGESVATVEALGGAGGTSIVLGTNPNSPNAVTQGSTANTATQVSVTVTSLPSEYSLVMLAVNIQKTGGVSTCAVTSITGLGIDWYQAGGSRVEYNTIATPVRAIEVWFGRVSNLSADLPADKTITVNFTEAPTSSRIFVDEIFNTDAIDGIDPLSGLNNYVSNSVDSATTLSMVLPTTATAGNGVWTFVGRSGGTAAASATGTILTSSDVAGSPGATMLGLATTTNTMTNTTNAALAGYSIEVAKPSVTQTRGSNGWNGRIVRIYG
jgi:hypothetical protein